ncbi:MAG: sensor domain-containing diguanylate cyclase [Candidatus Hydrogenedentes bacterium]|nr:sensor domain-containing diguanylate cyclase [Candidatus Hydrogenedentota bacterium]
MNPSQSVSPRVSSAVSGSLQDPFIPFEDASVYGVLAKEVLDIVSENSADGWTLALDAQTAMEFPAFQALRSGAKQIHLFGAASSAWEGPNVAFHPPVEKPLEYARMVLARSPQFCAGVWMGTEDERHTDSPWASGGWTIHRASVEAVFKELRVSLTSPADVATPDGREHDAGRALSTALRLARKQGRHFAQLRHDMATAKDDLFSVLEILKAISGKRRSHDILFVFVEKIAQVIGIDRCSVVRVWDKRDRGHVLASHEDETVDDLIIALDKYPELRYALDTQCKVVIQDVAQDPLTREYSTTLEEAGIRSLVVAPILLFDASVGSLLLRAARNCRGFTAREISFCEIVAEAASSALERANLFETLQKANERLETLATTDGLTGLYNHRYFCERLEGELARARRYGVPLSCLMLDMDNFKAINDTFGHMQGDQVLREAAERVRRTVRKSDVVARYGGEEFAVIMPQTGTAGARAQAERIREVMQMTAYEGLPPDFPVTVSVGVAVSDGSPDMDHEAMIWVADSALYEAKRQGKNQVVLGSKGGLLT